MVFVDLNRVPKKMLFVSNIAVIILFILAIAFLFTEIYFIKKHGGDCVGDPMGWAEKYALEKDDIVLNCYCEVNPHFSQLNITGG